MARLIPSDLDASLARGQAQREIETLRLLEQALPDDYTVFHGVDWTQADTDTAFYGEIDFVVVNRLGRAIAIEQKNGEVALRGGHLVKHYASGPKSIDTQIARNLRGLHNAFSRRHPEGGRLDLDHLLYLPDMVLSGALPASVDPSRVVDAGGTVSLPKRLEQLFAERDAPSGARSAGSAPADAMTVHDFLSSRLKVMPSVDVVSRQARDHSIRLAGGLATWAGRLSMAPFRLRVRGTAGSGKTQLALAELQAAAAAGRTALYLCFNRPLADAMRAAAPRGAAECMSFHELGDWVLRQQGETLDYAQPDAFERLADAVVEASRSQGGLGGSLDLLVVDEGQDFEPRWAEALERLVAPDGRMLWLEDPSQNLYRREPAELPGWVTLESPVNYRSPHQIVALINALGLVDREIEAGGPVQGFGFDILYTYPDADTRLAAPPDDDESEDPGGLTGLERCRTIAEPRRDRPAGQPSALPSLHEQTAAAVREFRAEGHAPADIAVIGWHGLARSRLTTADEIDGLATRRFTGRYDAGGRPVFSAGELQLETLFRFKGQAADCVVVTEIDFDAWSDEVRRRLFVALTRARLKLALVASERATAAIEARLDGR
ncbi:MAG: ATP-binding domain-containing protein [Burkholderiaceae bacterium]